MLEPVLVYDTSNSPAPPDIARVVSYRQGSWQVVMNYSSPSAPYISSNNMPSSVPPVTNGTTVNEVIYEALQNDNPTQYNSTATSNIFKP